MKEEVYYQMEAASGRMVRVPESRLESYLKAQEAIKRGEKPPESQL